MNEINFFAGNYPSFLKRVILNFLNRMIFYLIILVFFYIGSLQQPQLLIVEIFSYAVLVFYFIYSSWAAYADSVVLLKKVLLREDCFVFIYDKKNEENQKFIKRDALKCEKIVAILPYHHIVAAKIFEKDNEVLEQISTKFFWPSKNVKKLLSWIESKMNEGD